MGKPFEANRQFRADGTLESKVCSICGERKAAARFARDARRTDKHRTMCKACVSAKSGAVPRGEYNRSDASYRRIYTYPGMGGWRCLHHVRPVIQQHREAA